MSDFVLAGIVVVQVCMSAITLAAVRARVGKTQQHATLEHIAGIAIAAARTRHAAASDADFRRAALQIAMQLDERDNGKRDFTDRALAAAVDAAIGGAK